MRKHIISTCFLLLVCLSVWAVPAHPHKRNTNRQQMPARNICHMPKQAQVGNRFLPPRVLVIMAQFSDLDFQKGNTALAFDSLFNSDNYNYNKATGSVKKYFSDQSYGTYKPQFDVFGPVTLSKSVEYYGENKRGKEGEDRYAGEMIAEACKLADAKFDINFANYDNDNDGKVDAVYVIYAGYGESDGGEDYTIWPHNWTISAAGGTTPTIDGKKVSVYVCSSELYNEYWGNEKDYREGIGIMCHEFSHVLGLPDLYTTNGASHKTSGQWDLMDVGAYNDESRTPPAYSAYERFFMGWLTPTILNSPATINMKDINIEGKCYLVSENGTHNLNGVSPSPTVFYLIENRQHEGWDKALPGTGTMITKINYNSSIWNSNKVNNSSASMGIDIIEADGIAPTADSDDDGYYGKEKDLFPLGATSFTPFDKYPITKIQLQNGIVRFNFMGGKDDTPDNTFFDVELDLEYAQAAEVINSIKKGDTYSVKLTPIDGYQITYDDIVITMGFTTLEEEVDYTFIDNVLTIPNVQDDLYILVMATKATPTSVEDMPNIELTTSNHSVCIKSAETMPQVCIFNTLGQLITSLTNINIFETQMAQGLYFVRINTANGGSITRAIIIN